MRQVNVYQFYQLANAIHPLASIKYDTSLKEHFLALALGRIWLNDLLSGNLIQMTICRHAALKISNAIGKIIPDNIPEDFDMEKKLGYSELYDILQGVKEFETIFAAELQNLATYFVMKKGIYDTNDLILRADDIFTPTIKPVLSDQTKLDIKEAGKCIAFDLATAAGFHILRAVESVIVDYIVVLTGAKPKTSDRNWGSYIKTIRDGGGDIKACAVLDQIRELHRNPNIHPETILTMDEALTLLGIAQSAIITMVNDIVKHRVIKLPVASSSGA